MPQSFWSSVRSRLGGPRVKRLHREIETLELRALDAPLGARAELYTQMGDMCLQQEQRQYALFHFGRAIDVYLTTGRLPAAATLCRKLIRLSPEIVRARCTLAFLSLGEGLVADAERQIADYVRAARRAGMETLAAERLRLMATATNAHDIRALLGSYLLDLGDSRAADEVFGGVFAEQNGLTSATHEERRARWARLVVASLTGPVQIEQHAAN